jgi:hypothetical protein
VRYIYGLNSDGDRFTQPKKKAKEKREASAEASAEITSPYLDAFIFNAFRVF